MKAPHFFLASTFLLLSALFTARGQETREPSIPSPEANPSGEHGFFLGSDLVSRYVWRGQDLGNSAAVQPALGFRWKGLEAGAWGSYAITSHKVRINDSTTIDAGPYAECDLYASYTYKWFTFLFYDYFTVNGMSPNEGNRYFDYCNSTTGHTFEGSLILEGPEKLPFRFMVATLLYGADKNKDSTGIYGRGTQNNYSTYLELSWPFTLKKQNIELRPFVAGIPFGSSWYGPYAGITNLGFSVSWPIPAGKHFSIPIQGTLITNPQAQSVFFVFTLSLSSSNYAPGD